MSIPQMLLYPNVILSIKTDLLMLVKLMNVKFGLKTSGEMKTVQLNIQIYTVNVHSSLLNVNMPKLVNKSKKELDNMSVMTISTVMTMSILVIWPKSILNIYYLTVIIMVMKSQTNVNITIVQSLVKTPSDLNTVQITDLLIVNVHSTFKNVTDLGLVLISKELLLIPQSIMIPLQIMLSPLKMPLKKITLP